MHNWFQGFFYRPLINLKKANRQVLLAVILTFGMNGTYAAAQSNKPNSDIGALPDHMSGLNRSLEILGEIDKAIEGLDVDTPLFFRIDLDLRKLKVLADVGDTELTSEFALEIYKNYERKDYASDEQFGDTMQQLVQAFSKTKELALALEIIQKMRESVYKSPNTYLNFIIDKCRMEIYIETFNYARALETELSILNNPEYETLKAFINFRSSLYNEIAFLYNRLGNGEKALEYLEYAKLAFEKEDLHPDDLTKARTLNYGNRGRAYLLMGKYNQAEKMGQKVLKAGQFLGENYVIALGYRIIGSAAKNLGEYDKALKYLSSGVELSDKHNIATMKKYLYLDYALTYEKQGEFDKALYWHKKQFDLEYAAQKSVSAARAALNGAESRALENYEEIKFLKRENETQRDISAKDRRITQQLKMIILLLLIGASFLTYAFYSLRKSQRKLILSEKLAKESERKANKASLATSEFLANMSHEIRTPLNGVLGMAQVLNRTSLNETQKHYVNIISKSGNNLLVIINDILDFSKMEAEKLTLNLAAYNLEDSIEDVISLLTPLAADKNLKVDFEYNVNLPKYFIVDVDRVKQVISNLIGNAIKFTLDGRVSILVSGTESDGQVDLKIAIKDTGIGITEDKLAIIFDKFTQAESTTTRRFGGTGLGLAISHRLADAMSGNITASSIYGKGSTFTFSLPLKTVTTAAIVTEIKATPTSTPHDKKPSGRTIKILIAEDDEVNRSVITSFLNDPRIHLTVCEDGAKAVEVYKVSNFDIILMDVSMPVMDGLLATKTIRAFEEQTKRSATPIICLSAHVMIDDREVFMQAGMDDYLSKPLQRQDLFKIIRKWLITNKASSARFVANQPQQSRRGTSISAG